jgi:DMSO/TMAO reductase YedYZ molybdopterin-dependent catalytic subunit
VISTHPLEVESNLGSFNTPYTPIEDFYIRNHREAPRYSTPPTLRVEGEVARRLRLGPADLAHMKKLQLSAVLECAGNPVGTSALVSNGVWEGWSLWEIVEMARPSGGAKFIHLFGGDGYARSVPIQRAHDGGMLATDLGGRRLQPEHGAPWRAFFPGWYGMDSVKWLERIVISSNALSSAENEYVEMRPATPIGIVRRPLPPIQVKSIITFPADRGVVHRGTAEIRGLAWSGAKTISNVELSTDGGTNWHDVEFPGHNRYDWVLWRTSVELSEPGTLELACRATDAAGGRQPAQRDPERLDGYVQNWYHRIQVSVV